METFFSPPIFNGKVKADRREEEGERRGEGKGERNLARGETSRVASTKSLVSGFRPVSSRGRVRRGNAY